MPSQVEINNVYDQIAQEAKKRPPIGYHTVKMTMAGTHWPVQKKKLYESEITERFTETLSMVQKGILTAKTARLNQKNRDLMKRWFGNQVTTPRGWWQGVSNILYCIERILLTGVKVYYRGARDLIGKTSDYPPDLLKNPKPTIGEVDIKGIAEAAAGDKDGVLGLCKDFFKTSLERKNGITTVMRAVKLKGIDSVTGTIIHELSHNMCETEDHDRPDNGTACYGTADCLWLAKNHPNLAWYNADNIEYFCEENCP